MTTITSTATFARIDAITGMDAVELRRASCADYVAALLEGLGWPTMSATGERWTIRVHSQNADPKIVTRGLLRRVPVQGQYEDGSLAVCPYVWVAFGQDIEQVRVMAHEGGMVQVVSLFTGMVHLLRRGRLSPTPAGLRPLRP